MSPDDVRARVAEIVALAHDDEAAHVREDALHSDVLRAIADGACDDPSRCAYEALKTEAIRFGRWCS